MTEGEAKRAIQDCEKRIRTTYADLVHDAERLGSDSLQEAKTAKNNETSSASAAIVGKTVLPLLLSVLGVFLFSVSWFLALLLIIGGIVLAHKLYKKAVDNRDSVRRQTDSTVNFVTSQKNRLDEALTTRRSI